MAPPTYSSNKLTSTLGLASILGWHFLLLICSMTLVLRSKEQAPHLFGPWMLLHSGANVDITKECGLLRCHIHLKQQTGCISGEGCVNSKGKHELVLVKGTWSPELFCFLNPFRFALVENQLAFSSILKMLAYKTVFPKTMIPATREAKSAFNTYLEIFTEWIWQREGKKQSLVAYLHCLFDVPSPWRCSPIS